MEPIEDHTVKTQGSGEIHFSILILFALWFLVQKGQAQSGKMANDTVRLNAFCTRALEYAESNRDRSIYFGMRALEIARNLDQKFYEASILCDLGYSQLSNGDFSLALYNLNQASHLVEDENIGTNVVVTPYFKLFFKEGKPEENRIRLLVYIKSNLGLLYGKTRNPRKQIEVLTDAITTVKSGPNDPRLLFSLTTNLVDAFLEVNQLDSAIFFQKKVLEIDNKINSQVYEGAAESVMGSIFLRKGQLDSALKFYRQSHQILKQKGENVTFLASTYFGLSQVFKALGQTDSSLFFANATIQKYRELGANVPELADSYEALSTSFSDNHQYDSAFLYNHLAKKLSDSLHEKEVSDLARYQNMGFEELLRLKEAESEMKALQNHREIMVLIAGLVVISFITFLQYRNGRQRYKANKVLEATLSHLKATQNQLIQSEKMASLGELTAGIAHEIQNPLNFVNNFSELNSELIVELKDELEKGNLEEVKALVGDIDENEQKILHHGKRADAIVKGMLQHSRSSSGKKEPTDINALADEYLRLAYHGLRAKDKSFNAKMETDFDESIGKIDIIPQDIGRVILNLITNAFYVVDEKKRGKNREGFDNLPGLNAYEPTVSVSTKKLENKIEISVKDNGNGIPPPILDKIFQPFFTTKPTGQGTGLGLSLSYDIVKAHGGELKVETKEGQGTEFKIILFEKEA